MQQIKSYWYLLAGLGVMSAFAGAACTVSSSVDTTAGAAGEDTAGTAGTAGATNADAGGGSAGIGGPAAGTAGVAGATGGSGGVNPTTVPECDPEDGGSPTSTPATSCHPGVTDGCSTCVMNHCCAEYSACFGTSPGNVCGYGGPNNEGEFPCYRACLQKFFADNGSIGEEDRRTCASNCVTSTSALDCRTLGASTNALIFCLADDANMCNGVCYGG